MRTVSQFVTHASVQLNDQRPDRAFTRWGRGLLVEYLNLGIGEIATYRPEAFADRVKFTLSPGSVQNIPPDWDVTAIESNEDGTPVVKGDTVMARAYNTYAVCQSTPVEIVDGKSIYRVKTYGMDTENPRLLYVDPPVPNGVNASIYLNVMLAPREYTLADWDENIALSHKFRASLVDYILASAFTLDTESPQSRARSDQLYSKFYRVMGVKYTQESKYRAGYYLGKVGTGDPQAGHR
jgi:hypothetical protein